jgi:hypothetical protein
LKKKALGVSLVLALLFSFAAGTLLVDLANANPIAPRSYPQITINKNGSITPPTAPINRTGNVYTLSEDLLEQTIVIYRSDIVFEGAEHTISVPEKPGSGFIYQTIGIWLMPDEHADGVINRKNVTIRNLTVLGTIEIYCGDNCQIEKVRAKNIWIDGNSNTIKDSTCGVALSNNAKNNVITQNNINSLWVGNNCYSNKFYLNNFNLTEYPGVFSLISWDNGDIGNFWSNYTTKYPDAIELGNSGIGNTQYTIEKEYLTSQLERQYGGLANVTFMSIGYVPLVDGFPLMYPWGAPQLTLLSLENLTAPEPLSLNFSVSKPVVWTGYSLNDGENITIAGNTTLNGLTTGSHNITIYAKDTSGNIGASETFTFKVAPESILAEASEALLILTVVAVSVVAIVLWLLVCCFLEGIERPLK